MSNKAPRRLLFSVHGIRTLGHWQDALAAEAARLGWQHEPYRYGYFSLPRFLWDHSRRKIIEEFHDWYVAKSDGFQPRAERRKQSRPSIVAHSFGSFVVGQSMLKYQEIKFDKVILCGSILPPHFDWSTLIARNQVWRVRNEFGLRDKWVRLVRLAVPDTGHSGCGGFEIDSACIDSRRFNYHEHSDYFRAGHAQEHWFPFLAEKSLQVSLRHGREIADEGEFVRHLNRANEIDRECYSHLPHYSGAEIPRGLSTTWIRVWPDTYVFLFDELGRRLLGYVNAIPLRESVFRRVLSGELNDNEITAHDIIGMDRGEPVWLYLMSIAIDPGARKTGQGIYQEGFERLLAGVEANLVNYWQRFGSRVAEIGAVGWTAEGCQICESLALRKLGTDRQGNPTYALPVVEATRRPGRLGGFLARLNQRYQQA